MEEVQELYKKQDGRCAICGIIEEDCTVLFGVDHDHETGKIRGLLCRGCNSALGMLKDSPTIVLSAYNYLVEHKE